MSISFNQVPANSKVPFVFVEFDNSNAIQGNTAQTYRTLLIGNKTSAGTVTALTPTRVTSVSQAASLAGNGSHLHNMAQAYFASNTQTETWLVALADGGAHAAATGTVVISGTASAAGTLAVYIAGRKVEVGVAVSAAAATVATALSAAVNAKTELPVTATVSTGTVTLTAKNKGLVGNTIDVRLNFAQEDITPAGLTVTPPVTGKLTSGSGAPDLSTVWAVVDDTQYDVIVMPFTDSTSLTSSETEMADRNGPTRQQTGVVFVGAIDTHSNLLTLGNSRNSPFTSIMGANNSPSQPHEWAADVAANVAFYGENDPARPFTTLALKFVKAPPKADQFTLAERGLLLNDGISTFTVDVSGNVRIERIITTYQTNAAGNPDVSYLDVNTILTLSYLRKDFRTRITNKYPRHKLADDGTRFGAGQAIVTPSVIKGECVSIFRDWEEAGLVENAQQFIDDLIVERNSVNRNRLDVRMSPDIINQLLTMGVQFQFVL